MVGSRVIKYYSPRRSNDGRGALAGLRVLCLGDAHAPSLAAMLLADLGADVVHAVRDPGSRAPGRATLTRGARLLGCDGRSGRERARALAASADVIVHAGRTTLLDGLDVDPRTVVASLPAFAEGDRRGGAGAEEAAIAAEAGIFWDPQGGSPVATDVPVAGAYAGIAGAVAVAAALFERERSGLGQSIEIAAADAALLAIGAHGLRIDGRPAGTRPDDPWTGCFRTADDRWAMVCLTAPRFKQRFLAATGIEDWEARGFLDPARNRPGTAVREEHQAALRAQLAQRDGAVWEDLAAEAGFPLTVVRTRTEWVDDDHAHAAGLIVELDDPVLGTKLRRPGPAVVIGDPALGPPAPRVRSRDDAAQWSTPPWPLPAPAGPAPTGLPLEHVRVLDLTQVLAGPVVGRTLAELGAGVVKVNDPREQGPGWTWSEPRYHADVNRGKASLLVDLKQPAGQEVLWAVTGDADVVLRNFRPGVAERLGVDRKRLAERLPRAVVADVSAFGPCGPRHGRAGYEPDAQAIAGMAARDGASAEPRFETLTVNDYATGLLGALGVIVSLLARDRTGDRPPAVHVSLAATASTLQLSALERPVDGSSPEPCSNPGERFVAAADGWLLVAPGTPPDLCAGASAQPRDALVERLGRAGFGAHAVRSHGEVFADPRARALGVVVSRPDPTGAELTTVGSALRFSRSAVRAGDPVSRPGHDAPRLLEAAGLGERLAQLQADGIIGAA